MEGLGEGDPPKVEGTETVPAPPGAIETEGIGVGVGVVVEISCGVGIGVSVAVGLCPNARSATRKVRRVNPAAREFFRVTN